LPHGRGETKKKRSRTDAGPAEPRMISMLISLGKLLEVASLRHRDIAQNVANVNTPGYRRHDVTFEDAFAKAFTKGDEKTALKTKANGVEGAGGAERTDGHNVDIDVEMALLNKNSLFYRTVAQILAGEMASMRSAITGQ